MLFFVDATVTLHASHKKALRFWSKYEGVGILFWALTYAIIVAQTHPYSFFSPSNVVCLDLMCDASELLHQVTYEQFGHGQK